MLSNIGQIEKDKYCLLLTFESKKVITMNIYDTTESESEVTQSCLTLCDPVDCSLPGYSVHGIFQA